MLSDSFRININMKLQEFKVTESLIKIPERIYNAFSAHLEQEILNYMYHYKVHRDDYEPEHDNIKGMVAKIANKKGITIEQNWTKGKSNKLEIDIRPDDFPERYTPKTEKEDGYAKLQIVYSSSADEKAEGTHELGVRKNKWLHIIRILIGDIMQDVLIADKPKEQFKEIYYTLHRVNSTLRHELMHLTQDHTLKKTTSKKLNQKTGEWETDDRAFTGQTDQLPGYQDDDSSNVIHSLSPVEFDPMIDTEAARFRYTFYDRTLPVAEQIKDYIELSDFFKHLKGWRQTKSGKWKLNADVDPRRKTAIKKFAIRVEEYLT
jgi:predicted translin family RNA/ssDNA-binding protein